MELAGNEKKIQALFRELKLADEFLAPEFKRVWNRAQAPGPRRSRVFKISLGAAIVTALSVITLSSLLLWFQNWQRSQPSNPAVATGPATIDSTPATSETIRLGVVEPPNRVRSNRAYRRGVARRHPNPNAGNAAIRLSGSISSWQSPTVMLLQSPVDNVLTSLPQLDRSLTDLKTFLPNTLQGEDNE
jgi:hypothetical protein